MPCSISQLNAQQLREMVRYLAGTMTNQAAEIERKDREIDFKQVSIDKLTHEMAVLKRLRMAAVLAASNPEITDQTAGSSVPIPDIGLLQGEHISIPCSEMPGVSGTVVKGVADHRLITPGRKVGDGNAIVAIQYDECMVP